MRQTFTNVKIISGTLSSENEGLGLKANIASSSTPFSLDRFTTRITSGRCTAQKPAFFWYFRTKEPRRSLCHLEDSKHHKAMSDRFQERSQPRLIPWDCLSMLDNLVFCQQLPRTFSTLLAHPEVQKRSSISWHHPLRMREQSIKHVNRVNHRKYFWRLLACWEVREEECKTLMTLAPQGNTSLNTRLSANLPFDRTVLSQVIIQGPPSGPEKQENEI